MALSSSRGGAVKRVWWNGIHGGLKHRCRKAYEFESRYPYRRHTFMYTVCMKKYGNSDQEYIDAAAKSFSIAGMCRELGLKPAGGNYHTIKEKVALLGIDTSHFTGQASNLGKRFVVRPHSLRAIKKWLIQDRGHCCQTCENTEWLGVPITLEMEHVDGDTQNNQDDNLKLLCPNCHSQTKTWRRRKSVLG